MSALDKARAAWGDDLPDWVEALASACDKSTQAGTARRIGYSPATVSCVLVRRYAGDTAAVERAVRATILAETADCPELGEIALADCLEWRRRSGDFAATSGLRTRMFAACRACPKHGGGT